VIEQYKDEIIFYVYRKQDDSSEKLVGRIVYDTSDLAPLKREYWTLAKLTALSLGERFTAGDEFLKRIVAVKEWKREESE
jgi:hypothetical protein